GKPPLVPGQYARHHYRPPANPKHPPHHMRVVPELPVPRRLAQDQRVAARYASRPDPQHLEKIGARQRNIQLPFATNRHVERQFLKYLLGGFRQPLKPRNIRRNRHQIMRVAIRRGRQQIACKEYAHRRQDQQKHSAPHRRFQPHAPSCVPARCPSGTSSDAQRRIARRLTPPPPLTESAAPAADTVSGTPRGSPFPASSACSIFWPAAVPPPRSIPAPIANG